MNSQHIDLRSLEDFNNIEEKNKKDILYLFNLNRYKFILDELKKLSELVVEKKHIEKRMNELFKEGCLNFNIINSTRSCNLYKGGKYHLYENNGKYYLYLLKKNTENTENTNEKYLGLYLLSNDLLWKKVE